MVKSYLRFEHERSFGVIQSSNSNVLWVSDSSTTSNTHPRKFSSGCAVVAANEDVIVWDIKKGELLSRWHDVRNKAEVRAICHSQVNRDLFAVGYEDGIVRIWDIESSTVLMTFNGHRSAVTVLAFDKSGTKLASGSHDANINVWDLVGEVGLYKLRGHKDQLTGLEFLSSKGSSHEDKNMNDVDHDDGWLLTSGKDSLLKLWDLSTQHCVETHVAHQGECWGITLSPDQSICITAGNRGELKVWDIDGSAFQLRTSNNTDALVIRGCLYRQTKDRTASLQFHPNGHLVAVHGADKNVEIWRFREQHEIRKSLRRKRKRQAENLNDALPEMPDSDSISSVTINDVFVHHFTLRTGGRVRGINWAIRGSALQMLVACTNNSLEYYDIDPLKSSELARKKSPNVSQYNRLYLVDLPGHRTDVRALSLSSDDRMIASASNGELKIWNVRTMACIRSFECGYALCCSFLPGDKIVVVGTKAGEIQLFDVASSSLIETVQAHSGAIWSLHVHPDGKSMVTGSADKSAKFWGFDVVQEEIPGTKRTIPRLRLGELRILKMADDILSIRYSPNGALLATALLDNTVKVLFSSTLKLVLTLYGHKLPVLSLDISSDSKLIITCSADKNIRIWGLDFGDCHKAIFAHQDSVMSVAFERNTHHFFSAGKDRLVKYWDADKFENIMKMEGHFGEVWALIVGNVSPIVISASHDKSLRVWGQTEDQLFLDEERELELEKLYEQGISDGLEQDQDALNGNIERDEVGKQTIETLKDGERIVEVLDIGLKDLENIAAYNTAKVINPNLALPLRHAIFIAFGGVTAERHVLNVISKIRTANLQDALLVLPFDRVQALLRFCRIWAERGWSIALTWRLVGFVLRVHHWQIVASKSCREVIIDIRKALRCALKEQMQMIGRNLAGAGCVKELVEEARDVRYVDNTTEKKMYYPTKRGFASLE